MAEIDNWAKIYKIQNKSLIEEKDQEIAKCYFFSMLGNAPNRLRQIVPISDENTTNRLLVCGETDTRYFDCDFFIDDEFQDHGDSVFFTAEQLKLFSDLGSVEYNDEIYNVQKIIPSISCDERILKCRIYLIK